MRLRHAPGRWHDRRSWKQRGAKYCAMECEKVLAALIPDNSPLSPQADTKEISVAINTRICCSCARLIDVNLHSDRIRCELMAKLTCSTTNKGIDRYEECDYQGCCRCSVHHVGRLRGHQAPASRRRQSQTTGEPPHRRPRRCQE